MSTVLEPGSTSRDVIRRYILTSATRLCIVEIMIRTALALDLDQDGEILGVLAIPRLEGFQELETVALGVNSDLDGSTVLRRSLEGVFAGVVATRRKFMSVRVVELEGLAINTSQSIGDRVESEIPSEGHGSNDIGRSDEGMGGRVSIVAASEVAVVGSDD